MNREEDFKWFVENYYDLYEKYGHKFFVIKDKNILGIYDSVVEALDNTHEELGTFIIQECNGDESGYTVYLN